MQERVMTHLVDARLVALVKPFMGAKDVRSYLNGVHIRSTGAGGVAIEATNGHVCAVIHQEDGLASDDNVIIKGEVVAKLPKTGKIAIYSDGSVEAIADKGDLLPRYERAVNEGKFPDTPKVFPDFSQLTKGLVGSALNASYVLKGLEFFKAFSTKNRFAGQVEIYQGSEQGVILMASYMHDAFVLIMPCRDDGIPRRPNWL